MPGYDIIGDVHGCADKLVGLLKKLGYEERRGVYRHPERQAIFVGDLIDRGEDQVKTLALVRAMVDAGDAQIAMGNHEVNAISYATPNPEIPGEFMRPRSEKNRAQHKAFTDQVQVYAGLYAQSVEWFKSMPLYLDLDGLRVVHACWSDSSIRTLERWVTPGNPMPTDFVVRANLRGTSEHDAIEVSLKGPELGLKRYGQKRFTDPGGQLRNEARIRWWSAKASTLDEVAEIPEGARTEEDSPYPPLPKTECKECEPYRYGATKPVFYGHYWRDWAPKNPLDWTTNTACVDFSAGNGGPLVAYRWDGESEINPRHYIEHPETRRTISRTESS
jgi:hypothetical protein